MRCIESYAVRCPEARPNQETIQTDTRMSARTIKYAISELEADDWLHVVRQHRWSNVYTLTTKWLLVRQELLALHNPDYDLPMSDILPVDNVTTCEKDMKNGGHRDAPGFNIQARMPGYVTPAPWVGGTTG